MNIHDKFFNFYHSQLPEYSDLAIQVLNDIPWDEVAILCKYLPTKFSPMELVGEKLSEKGIVLSDSEKTITGKIVRVLMNEQGYDRTGKTKQIQGYFSRGALYLPHLD